jgi:glycosyltransferase involved in cell wall biosynthesis
MRIAQVSPLWESVPPKLYGGTERVVSFITDELVRLGHHVTLFASGDSVSDAYLEAICPQALRLITGSFNREAPMTLLLERAFSASDEFDVIHSHLDFLGFPVARRCPTPVLTTLHGRLDLPELEPVYREFSEIPLVSISDAQRQPLPWANWQATVHHGLPRDLYTFHPQQGQYLAFLGRIAPEKCPDQAIAIATRAGIPLRIAAKVDPADRDYFRERIEPLLDHPLIEYLGEITDAEKNDFLGGACALLAPFDWPEPFGLVFIEALACGTPVLAYRRGSVPEIIDDGITGYICKRMSELTAATKQVSLLDRRRCREVFEARFTVDRMVQDYLNVYEQIVSDHSTAALRSLMRSVTNQGLTAPAIC